MRISSSENLLKPELHFHSEIQPRQLRPGLHVSERSPKFAAFRFGRLQLPVSVYKSSLWGGDLAHLLSQFLEIVTELVVNFLQSSLQTRLFFFVANRRQHDRVAIRGEFQFRLRRYPE